MEVWRVDQVDRPKVTSTANFVLALCLHVAFGLLLWIYSLCHFKPKETVTAIDLTVVVNENLDGNEEEPPPLDDPPPPPPPKPEPPKPETVKEPEKPKELEQIVTNIVKKVDKKEKKKDPPPKKKPPQKSKKELREERLKKMREEAKTINKPVEVKVKGAPSGNGRTDRKTLTNDQIRDLLNKGYVPGKTTQLAASDEQLGFSLIKKALEEKWDKPPWTDTLRPMVIRLWFGSSGKIVNFKLEASSGDAKADRTIKTAASRVGGIPQLPKAFIDKYRSVGVSVKFEVKPQ